MTVTDYFGQWLTAHLLQTTLEPLHILHETLEDPVGFLLLCVVSSHLCDNAEHSVESIGNSQHCPTYYQT